jgi:carboxymethylenebutenolidase
MKSALYDLLARTGIRRTMFISGGKQITLEYRLPAGPGPHAAVLLLHGSNGAASSAPSFHFIMQGLVNLGCAAFFPHYFERTGDGDLGDGEARDSAITRSFLLWQETIRDAAEAVRRLPSIDPARIALLGVSLGSYLALGAAADHSEIRCLITFCGGLPENLRQGPSAFPPVLILHGEDDQTVPVAKAYELDRVLTAKQVPHELVIYPGEGHLFQPAAQQDAAVRCRDFLAAFL